MLKTKYLFILVVVLYIVHGSLSKPVDDELTQGRGMGSTLWEWITYPFSWWSSKKDEPVPVTDQLIASTTVSTTIGLYDKIDIGKHNVTVWCNDQTCTTMKCNQDGCKNNTCIIYDTDTTGVCREYTTIVDPEVPSSPQPATSSKPPQNTPQTEISTKTPQEIVTKGPESVPIPIAPADSNNQEEERPLQLEELMSSTVDQTSSKQ